MPSELEEALRARGLSWQEGVPLAPRTTLKVGGPAALWVDAQGAPDIEGALAAARDTRTPVFVLGGGSNILVRDGGFGGLVIAIGPGMDGVEIDGGCIRAGAGARLAQVAQVAQAAGLSGLEALAGIPGTVGGAVYMNAGAYGVETGQRLAAVTVLTCEGTREMAPADLAFGYRDSLLMRSGWIALDATFSLAADDPNAIRERMRDIAAQRRAKQPLSLPSAGSFFKRPQGHFAGALIEAAGLKGLKIGGAQVSELHAGFLVNAGGATARDFLNLMEIIQTRVREDSGVWLEPEVRIIGCDTSF